MNQDTQEAVSMTDATVTILLDHPAQISLRFYIQGYDGMLVLRGEQGRKLIEVLPNVIKKLEQAGATPALERSVPASNGSGPPPPAGGQRICPHHNVPLKPSKFGGYYCPERVGEHPQTGKTLFCTYKED